MAAYDIYPAELAQLRHGYALWCPEPWDYDEVKLGDVGYLWRGAFYRLFNATLAADHPDNAKLGVPHAFVPLVVPPSAMYRNDKFFDAGPLHSYSVKRFEYGASASGSVAHTIQYPVLTCLINISFRALGIYSQGEQAYSSRAPTGKALSSC